MKTIKIKGASGVRKESKSIEIQEEVRIPGTDIILEAGDRILLQSLEEEVSFSEIHVQAEEGVVINNEPIFNTLASDTMLMVNVGTRQNDLKTLTFNLKNISNVWGGLNEDKFHFRSQHGLTVKLS